MLNVDEALLECDLAETYGILDYRELPIERVALFSLGLREDSRIKMKMNGQKASDNTILLASIVDRLSLLWWAQTEDGQKGVNRPEMITNSFLQKEERKGNKSLYFSNGDEFMKFRNKFMR